MTAQDAAKLLGCSPQRIKQLVEEGRLPGPIKASDRIHLHRRPDVELYRDLAAGEDTTLLAALMPSAPTPLRRIVDLIYKVPEHWTFGEVWQHVRVWRGPVDGVDRTVVLLSTLHGSPEMLFSTTKEIAAHLDRELLGGTGRDAVWLLYSRRTESERPRVVNAVLRDATRSARGSLVRRMARWADHERRPGDWEPFAPSMHPLESVLDIDRLVGEPVETFPGETYTRETVDRWQRTRTAVPVVVDPIGLRANADALRVLTEHSSMRPEAAHWGARALAGLLRERESASRQSALSSMTWVDRVIRDGGAQAPTDLDERHVAARMIAASLTDADHAAMESAGAPLQVNQLAPALNELRDWADDADEFADRPDPRLHSAISHAIEAVTMELSYERLAIPERRIAEPINVRVVGKLGRRFLDQITWEPAGARHSRRHRVLAHNLIGGEQARFGYDLDGNLIAHVTDRIDAIAAEWPDTASQQVLRTATAIVAEADDKPGAIAVFLETPDGLRLLPRYGDRYNGWQFGYPGSSPGHLVAALIDLVEATHEVKLVMDQRIALRQWLDGETERPATSLRIDTAELGSQLQRVLAEVPNRG